MKTTTSTIILGALLISGISIPYASEAAVRTRTSNDAFCAALPELGIKMAEEISTRKTDFISRENTELTTLSNRRQELAGKVTTERDTADTSRILMYRKLDALTTTPEKVAAVTEFKTTLDAALLARRTRVDSAINTYEDSLTSLVKQNFSDTNAALTTYGTAVQNAFATATQSCTAVNGNPKSIRADLKKQTESARTTLRESISKQNLKKSVDSFTAVRAATIADATKAYQNAFTQARAKLETVLK